MNVEESNTPPVTKNTDKEIWFAMRAPFCRELEAARLLKNRGVENFVPMSYKVVMKRNGTKSREFVPSIHNLIFVRTSLSVMKSLKKDIPVLQYYVRRENGKNIYAELDCEAAKVPIGCENLILLPHMYGERNPTNDPYARGVLYGLSINHAPIHIYRAIMESYCYSVRHALTAMEKNNEIIHLDNIFVSGGGAKSKLWRQMTSDILKCDTYFYQKADETRAGAYLAAMGAGYFDNVDTFYKNWLCECEYTSTNIDDSIKYDKVYKIYENIYERLKGSYKSLTDI